MGYLVYILIVNHITSILTLTQLIYDWKISRN